MNLVSTAAQATSHLKKAIVHPSISNQPSQKHRSGHLIAAKPVAKAKELFVVSKQHFAIVRITLLSLACCAA